MISYLKYKMYRVLYKNGDEVYDNEMWSSTLYMHYNLIIVTIFDIA
jgi:hypothetical protein